MSGVGSGMGHRLARSRGTPGKGGTGDSEAGCSESKRGPRTSCCVEVGREGHSWAQQLQAQVGTQKPSGLPDAVLMGLRSLTSDLRLSNVPFLPPRSGELVQELRQRTEGQGLVPASSQSSTHLTSLVLELGTSH